MEAGEADVSPASEPAPSANYEGIAILGSHPATKKLAPFDDPKWLIYACSPDNSPYGVGERPEPLPRVDVWFELHNPIAHPTRPYRYLRWLEDLGVPIVMRDGAAMPAFKTAVQYPDKALKERFGFPIFTSSVAYMIAKAIVDCESMNIPTIGLWGIMQQSKAEFLYHVTGTKQMLWEAHKAGLRVAVPEEAQHLFEEPPDTW